MTKCLFAASWLASWSSSTLFVRISQVLFFPWVRFSDGPLHQSFQLSQFLLAGQSLSVTWFRRRWRQAIVVLCSGFCCFLPLRSTVCCSDGFPLFLFRNKSNIWISNVRRRRCIWHWFRWCFFHGNLPFGDWNFRSLSNNFRYIMPLLQVLAKNFYRIKTHLFYWR